MKRILPSTAQLLVLCASLPALAGVDLDATFRELEARPGYGTPVATTTATILDQGWVRSSKVGGGSGWDVSIIPVGLATIQKEDQTFERTHVTGCATFLSQGLTCEYAAVETYDVPTIWGPNRSDISLPTVTMNTQGGPVTTMEAVAGGNADLNQVGYLALPYVQAGFAYRHARLVLRAFPLSFLSIGAIDGFSVYGAGLQYDFTHHIPRPMPVNFSALAAWSTWSLGYKPGDEYDGSLELSGSALYTALVCGYRYGMVEFFTEMGYESGSAGFGGEITNTETGEVFHPNVTPDGRNGFKVSLQAAFHFGTYLPVLGTHYGAQTGMQASLFQFGKESEE